MAKKVSTGSAYSSGISNAELLNAINTSSSKNNTLKNIINDSKSSGDYGSSIGVDTDDSISKLFFPNSDTSGFSKGERLLNDLKEINPLYEYVDNEDIILNELANQNTAQMQAYNASEAEKNRQWQTQMSNTSHQREVADLRAAGLNPVLSANSGATAYTSSPASSTIDSAISALANKEMNRLTTASTIKAAEISAEMVGEAAKISAEASKYASNMAYKSSKYSANKGLAGMQASASATRAAAAANAAATQYAANMNYAGTKYNTDNTRSGTLWGTIGSGASSNSKVGSAIRKGINYILGK